ncbi:hypothetical protein PIROE2DRAFT_6567 [Piromyces sp. E2]|nr:hypothetical protein PIROE2DRAFT_6567 [Piromyces sp. E2]|eukprot:OUM66229.1 hypothetical protein PIROE2DRAFT_6567 [Piromyces sp. E2]
MNYFYTLISLLIISFSSVFVSANGYSGYKPSEGSSELDFPPFENGFTGKNGFYILYYEDQNKFPTLLPALACRLNIKDKIVYCRVEDSVDEEIIKKKFGGAAQLVINNIMISNPNECNSFEKLLTEVSLYNNEDIEYQIIGSTFGDLYSKKFTFTLQDECEFYAEFDGFYLESL